METNIDKAMDSDHSSLKPEDIFGRKVSSCYFPSDGSSCGSRGSTVSPFQIYEKKRNTYYNVNALTYDTPSSVKTDDLIPISKKSFFCKVGECLKKILLFDSFKSLFCKKKKNNWRIVY